MVLADVPDVVRKMDAMNGRKVLYISYDGLTDPLGQSQILPYLSRLSKLGYAFTILSFEKKARYLQEKHTIEAIVANAGIEWVPLFFTARPPVLSKIYDRYQMRKKALNLQRQKAFDVVHCRSYVAAEIGLLLKQQFGVKFLFDMRGFWADEKVDNGQWNLQKPFYNKLYQFYKRKEKAFLLAADGIISLTEAAKQYLLQQPAYKRLAIDVIPCCADLDHFNYINIQSEEVEAVRKKIGIPSHKKVITYLGSVGGWYMTSEMFRFFAMLQQQNENYVMLILTKDQPSVILQEAAAMGIGSEQLFITYAERKVLPQYMALSSCSIFFIRNTFSKMASSPTKHAELMGMGIPVICNDIGDTGNIIRNTQTGFLVDSFTEESLLQSVRAMPIIESMDKAVIRSAAYDLFDLEAGVQKYLSVYQSIFSDRRRTVPANNE